MLAEKCIPVGGGVLILASLLPGENQPVIADLEISTRIDDDGIWVHFGEEALKMFLPEDLIEHLLEHGTDAHVYHDSEVYQPEFLGTLEIPRDTLLEVKGAWNYARKISGIG